jgi:hypothetical protein
MRQMRAKGSSYQAIADALHKTHGIDLAERQVNRILSRGRRPPTTLS